MTLREFLSVIPCDTELRFLNFVGDNASPEREGLTCVRDFFDKPAYSMFMGSEVLTAKPCISIGGKPMLEVRIRSAGYFI